MAMAKISAEKEKLDIKSFLTMMDVASAIRKQKEEIDKQLNIDETKADLRKRILETSKVTGESLTEDEVNLAIESYFSGLYSFKEPERNLGYALAGLYVNRDEISNKYVKPAVAVALLGALSWSTVKLVMTIRSGLLEDKVEKSVKSEYNKKMKLQNKLNILNKSQDKEILENANISKDILKGTDKFFMEYCSDGTPEDDVTRQNYKNVEQQLSIASGELDKAGSYIEKGEGIIKLNDGLIATRKGLELLINEIKNNNPPKQLMTQAESHYQNGIASIEKKNLSQAKEYYNNLNGVKTDAKEFAVLPSEADRLYNAIKSIALENAAIEQADNLYRESKLSAENVNVKQLRQAVGNLGSLDNLLEQEYKITIVSREGVKSGIDRYYKGELSGYYLIVEARDSKGNAIQKQIKNVEDGKTYNVTMWGEKVSKAVYERVKQDKMDDGIVNDNIFGTKQRGYMNDSISMKGENGKPLQKAGQITSW
jgi:hypothetical protein